MSVPESPRGGGSGFLRGLMMTVGLLIMVGSGLCSAGALASMIYGVLIFPTTHESLASLMWLLRMVGFWGGLPFLLGLVLYRGFRRKREPETERSG